jgi:hypothetical protein
MQIFKQLVLIALGFAALASTVACGDKDDDTAEEMADE